MHGHHSRHGGDEAGCGCGCHSRTCPSCGCAQSGNSHGFCGEQKNMKHMVFGAYKQALMARIEAEISSRHGDKLDATAKELVDIAEDKMKMKADFGRRTHKLFEHMMGDFTDTGDDEEAG